MMPYRLPNGKLFNLPENKKEAEYLANLTKRNDPFEDDIAPSLLNKNDIIRYVSATGMIQPFYPDSLKPASYEVKVGSIARYWDNEGKKHDLPISDSSGTIPLRKNSITYVSIESSFFLPYYIAARFNLSITHVHRGLLLGTGPLVDPGFCGDIMIPLHNLTNNDYYLNQGDTLIAVEFTKLTPDEFLKEDEDEVWYKKNVKWKERTFQDYFNSALPAGINSVDSSVGKYIADATLEVNKIKDQSDLINKKSVESIDNINKYIDDIREKFQFRSIIGAISVVIALVVLTLTTWQLVNQAHQYVTDSRISNEQIKLMEIEQAELRRQVSVMEQSAKDKEELIEIIMDLKQKINTTSNTEN